MKLDTIEPVIEKGYKAEIIEGVIHITGFFSDRNPVKLRVFFEAVHEKALEAGLDQVTIDLRELDFIGSIFIGIFIQWIFKIHCLPAESQYYLTILRKNDTYEKFVSSLVAFCPNTIKSEEL